MNKAELQEGKMWTMDNRNCRQCSDLFVGVDCLSQHILNWSILMFNEVLSLLHALRPALGAWRNFMGRVALGEVGSSHIISTTFGKPGKCCWCKCCTTWIQNIWSVEMWVMISCTSRIERKINFPISWEEEPDLLFGFLWRSRFCWLLGMNKSSSRLLERGMGLCKHVSFLYNSFKVFLGHILHQWGIQHLSIPATPSHLLCCVKNIKHNQSSWNCGWFMFYTCILKIAMWEECSAEKQCVLETGLQVYESGASW